MTKTFSDIGAVTVLLEEVNSHFAVTYWQRLFTLASW